MCLHSLLSLPHLLARCTQGREPLIDYSQSNVVTSRDYLNVLQKKNINKATADNIRKAHKEKEEKQARKAMDAQRAAMRVTQKTADQL